MSTVRWGVLGGSFDPVHFGHLLLAERCREELKLDHVLFVPAAQSPLKAGRAPASPQARVEMLQLAIAGRPQFSVSRAEIERGGLSYTVDTLAKLHEEDPERELFFILGSDAVLTLPQWREPERLCRLAQIVFVERPGSEVASWAPLEAALPADVVAGMKSRCVQMPRMEISSRDIRARAADGRSIRYLTPRAVEAYIETHRLYQPVAE